MEINASYIFQQDLLRLKYSRPSIAKLVTQAEFFKDIKRKHGYAIQYDFNQALAICIGCELLDIGLSFRHVNIILNKLKGEEYQTDLTYDDVLVVFNDANNFMKKALMKRGRRTRESDLYKEAKVRTKDLFPMSMKHRDFMEMIKESTNNKWELGSFICLDLYEIRRKLQELF